VAAVPIIGVVLDAAPNIAGADAILTCNSLDDAGEFPCFIHYVALFLQGEELSHFSLFGNSNHINKY